MPEKNHLVLNLQEETKEKDPLVLRPQEEDPLVLTLEGPPVLTLEDLLVLTLEDDPLKETKGIYARWCYGFGGKDRGVVYIPRCRGSSRS